MGRGACGLYCYVRGHTTVTVTALVVTLPSAFVTTQRYIRPSIAVVAEKVNVAFLPPELVLLSQVRPPFLLYCH